MRKQFPGKVEHGGKVHRHRSRGEELLDFSANINPYPPAVDWKPDPAVLAEYPDDRYERLKEAIGRRFNRNPDEITVGNGSIEVIRSFCYSVLDRGDGVHIEQPTFGEYELSARLAGAVPVAEESRAAARFLCNPNNPTGRLLPRKEVCSILERTASGGAYLFIDEAFVELADPRQSLADIRHERLFVLRSITKSFAVPGIRFGYGFGDPDLIARMEVMRLPWTVNAWAESFAIQAFSHYDELERSRERIARERGWLCRQLAALDLGFEPPSANYILVRIPMQAADLTERLLKFRILVRDCSSFGLPGHIRVAVRTHDENRRLVEALAACLR
ncbi:MAG: histidinol-phosphate aminotransferase family protein [Methanomicrobiaceae archaeon]|nr:histidinol-phosphate aminotransferase family protein [Methanomicrobiaceae archaeon]MDD5418452.1 histidinol-phosphate transaminase [Methanomicrobiaceae archaeon]